MREEFFLGLKVPGMDAALRAGAIHGMFDVEHFVIENVGYDAMGHAGLVEKAGDGNGMMGGIIMAEDRAARAKTPAKKGHFELARKVLSVEVMENLLEVEVAAGGVNQALDASLAAGVLGAAADILAHEVAAVDFGHGPGGSLAKELGQKNVGEAFLNGGGSVLEKVGDSDGQLALHEADFARKRGEGMEFDVNAREAQIGAQIGENTLVNFLNSFKENRTLNGHSIDRLT
jgi:hypothetical protein